MQVLSQLPRVANPDVLAGHEGFEDAGVFRLRPDLAIVQTVDFFPPIVDDPVWFGRIAAANSLSDIYAMGATPITGLNVVAYPADELPMSVLGEILRGGAEKMVEAGAAIIGGHSVVDEEIKYGIAVTGTVHPDRIARNGGGQVGDRLVLTKPIGMGTMATALKKGKLSSAEIEAISRQMAELNKNACEAMLAVGIHGCTDITGFGLLGHTVEMAEGSRTTIVLEASKVPVFEGAASYAAKGLLSGGCERAKQFLEGKVRVASSLDREFVNLCFDAETSGGLMIAVGEARHDALLAALAQRGVTASTVGRIEPRRDVWLELTP